MSGDLARGMQADWFIREVKRCREIGMPLGCCDYWPECAHVVAWTEERENEATAQLCPACEDGYVCRHGDGCLLDEEAARAGVEGPAAGDGQP